MDLDAVCLHYSSMELKEQIRRAALDLGFARVGFADASEPLPHQDDYDEWLRQGYAGQMGYLHRHSNRSEFDRLLPDAKTAIVVAARYADGRADQRSAGFGRVARYARGEDYHQVLRRRLLVLQQRIGLISSVPFEARALVDTAPLLERELAMKAGVGFIGKNTMLITPGVGSYTVLGTLLLTLPLPADLPEAPRCGACTLCLGACPTGAFVEPYRLDARRCVSYLTIEYRGDVEESLARGADDWVFGCDACQEVCPYNVDTPVSRAVALDAELAPEQPMAALALDELIGLRSAGYRRLVKGRALRRTPRSALVRNGRIVRRNRDLAAAPGEG